MLARLGGEEFLLWLPETDAAGTAPLLERQRAEVATLGIACLAGSVGMTVAAGLAESLPDQSQDWSLDRVIACADEALY